jgi:hypothetical protein
MIKIEWRNIAATSKCSQLIDRTAVFLMSSDTVINVASLSDLPHDVTALERVNATSDANSPTDAATTIRFRRIGNHPYFVFGKLARLIPSELKE